MNVLLIPSSFPTRREPWPGSYIYEYARSLALRHEVTVVYPQQSGSPGVGDEPFFTDEWLEPRVRLVNYSYAHLPKSWMLSYFAAFRRVWWRVRHEWKIDVIFAHVVMPAGLAALQLGRLLRIPVILTEHWGPARDWLEGAGVPRRLQYAALEHTYRKVNYLTAVSDSLADEIKAVFGASVNGKLDYPIDCEVFRPARTHVANGSAPVLCVTRGRFDPRKGVDNLLAAWEMVSRRTGGSVRLDIVGPDVEALMPQIEAKGIGETCRLLPWRPSSELAPLMRGSALVVIPSRYETFGRSGAEALASGVPVVATNCGGPAEYVGEGTGLLVPPEDPSALAEGILAGLKRRDFLPPEELARRIRERFGYEAICQRFTEIATELTSERKSR
jgi:glycosyltransferase involved in cell wall biosynthesis